MLYPSHTINVEYLLMRYYYARFESIWLSYIGLTLYRVCMILHSFHAYKRDLYHSVHI